ncbi:MAG: hypothetical protein KA981_06385 [Bacteroidia bacterium]|nr:hypothetical protein [Bacteroidia bacterium]
MKTLTIELLNDKAETLLEDLVELDLIKIVKYSDSKNTKLDHTKKPSDFFGMLSSEDGKQILNYVNESRAEWEKDI